MSIRKRRWKTRKGEAKEAWIVDYVDQRGKRHTKACETKKEADAHQTKVKIELRNGTCLPRIEGATAAETDEAAAKKFLHFIDRKIEPACYLYRHYHPNGDLLYVGISLRGLNRQQKHINDADWRNIIHKIVIEPFETRESALEAEEAAIRLEFPKFNAVHNGRRNIGREISQGLPYRQ